MVPPRRRVGRQISYRESESEEDDEQQDESFADTGEDSDNGALNPLKRRRTETLPASSLTERTRRLPRKTYKESSDEEIGSDYGEASLDVRVDKESNYSSSTRNPKRMKILPQRTQRAERLIQRRPHGQERRSVPSRPPANMTSKPKDSFQHQLWLMGPPCPWTTLPPLILKEILFFASYPLFDEHGAMTPNVQWLSKLRNLHPALLEASIDVLYFCPPITSSVAAHNFLSVMSLPSDEKIYDYNVKVKQLELEVRNTLSYSAGPELGSFDVATLVKQLPQLHEIDIWSIYDDPTVRRNINPSRTWSYPDSLFDALSQGQHRLRSFHWNSRFLSKQTAAPMDMYQWMRGIHDLSAFKSLRCLKLTGFLGDSDARIDLQFPIGFSSPGQPLSISLQNKESTRLEKKEKQWAQDEHLARAINVLPNLRQLDLHLCSVVDGEWLRLLPKNLSHLGIIECDRLMSDDLQDFLHSHGGHLRVLALNHNPALSVAFLTSLKYDCPRLEELRMDLTYYRKLGSIDGSEIPGYEHLLLPDERPTWPTTLRSLYMNHLHQWTSPAADVFFTSLVESAEDLPDLRKLELTASLDVSWRERAKLRDQWEDRFKRVFLRKAAPPNSAWWSIQSYHNSKANLQGKPSVSVVIPPVAVSSKAPASSTVSPTEDDSDAPRRRLRPRKAATEDEEAAGLSQDGKATLESPLHSLEKHHQGMCEIVDVRIDNLRPREQQFDEEDFLDDEPSGDEEWDERRGDLDDEELYFRRGKRKGKYAW